MSRDPAQILATATDDAAAAARTLKLAESAPTDADKLTLVTQALRDLSLAQSMAENIQAILQSTLREADTAKVVPFPAQKLRLVAQADGAA